MKRIINGTANILCVNICCFFICVYSSDIYNRTQRNGFIIQNSYRKNKVDNFIGYAAHLGIARVWMPFLLVLLVYLNHLFAVKNYLWMPVAESPPHKLEFDKDHMRH